MEATRQFKIVCSSIDKKYFLSRSLFVPILQFVSLAIGALSIAIVLIISFAVPEEYAIYKIWLVALPCVIACLLLRIFGFDCSKRQDYSYTLQTIKLIERNLEKRGVILSESYQKIKGDIQQQRDDWREKIHHILRTGARAVSLCVLAPGGFMFTLLLSTAYKNVVFEDINKLSREMLAIISICMYLLIVVAVMLAIYAIVILVLIPHHEERHYGRYLSLLEDMGIYYGDATTIKAEQKAK